MSGFSKDDLTVISGEARISDDDLRDALGFARIDHLRRLIKSNIDELRDFGEVFLSEGENLSPRGGRPTKTYYLNEHQAVAICMWAQTKKARAARLKIIDVYVAYRKGELESLPPREKEPDVFEQAAARAEQTARQLQALDSFEDFAFRVAQLPLWANGRRPKWFADLEVRSFLIATHRQMTTIQAEAVGRKRYGTRCPGKSTINVFWRKLDAAFGLPVRSYPRTATATGRRGVV